MQLKTIHLDASPAGNIDMLFESGGLEANDTDVASAQLYRHITAVHRKASNEIEGSINVNQSMISHRATLVPCSRFVRLTSLDREGFLASWMNIVRCKYDIITPIQALILSRPPPLV